MTSETNTKSLEEVHLQEILQQSKTIIKLKESLEKIPNLSDAYKQQNKTIIKLKEKLATRTWLQKMQIQKINTAKKQLDDMYKENKGLKDYKLQAKMLVNELYDITHNNHNQLKTKYLSKKISLVIRAQHDVIVSEFF